MDEYRKKRALWMHDGSPKKPHALLTSGMHSSGFFNSRLVIPDDLLLRAAADDLLALFFQAGGQIAEVDGVVGPQTGATRLAELLCQQVSGYTSQDCFSASPAKDESGEQRRMVFTAQELRNLPGQHILLCEDVLSTGGSVMRTERAVVLAGGIVLPFVLVLVNRSGMREVHDKRIVALIDHDMPMWSPTECPLCAGGSEAIRAKGENWDLLNA